jgi:hypothetical protein
VARGNKYEIWKRLYERGAGLKCPVCAHEIWMIGLGDMGNLHIFLEAASPQGEVLEVPGSKGGLPVHPIVCANCGFVRLHSLEVLENPPEPGDGPR